MTARKPTALKIVEGNRGKRPMNKQEPDPEYLAAGDLVAPSWLNARAKAVWDEIAPPLQKARLVAVIDVPLLAMACVAIEQFRYATEQVADGAAVCVAKGEKGESLNPWLIVQSMSFKQACQILRDFGVSPSARTRIALQPQLGLFDAGQGERDSRYFDA